MNYRLCGLVVESEIALPIPENKELVGSPVDLEYRLSKDVYPIHNLVYRLESSGAKRLSRIRQGDHVGFSSYLHEGSIYLIWNSIDAAFQIDPGGGQVRITNGGSKGLSHVPWLLMGVVLGYILHLRGFLCLHASVVEHGGRCIAILGTNKRGKSTLTASLLLRGWSLVSDDLLCIEDVKKLSVRKCFPYLKLDQDVILQFNLGNKFRARIPGTTKEAVTVDGEWSSFSKVDRPVLDSIYAIQRISAADLSGNRRAILNTCDRSYARACLVSNGYAAGFLDVNSRRRFVDHAAALALQIPTLRLGIPWGFSHLDDVADLLTSQHQ